MEQVTVAIECDRDVADELAGVLTSTTGAAVHSATKSSLDGSLETVLQLVQLTLTAAAVVPAAVASLLDRGKIRKIRLGDLEIENPTAEQCERLWQEYVGRSDRPEG